MKGKTLRGLALLAALGCTTLAQAAGFYLIEKSVSSMGNAYAGASAAAEDVSFIAFNPASMTRFCGNQIAAGGHVVLPSSKFHNDDSPYKPAPIGGLLTGGNGKDAGEPAFVGNFYASHQVNDCLWVGLGVNSPFGLVTEYGHEWVGRYYAIRSAMMTIDINPQIAYKFNDCWSFGAGFTAMYLHAKLTNAIDFGFLTQNPQFFQNLDGKSQLKGNSWGYGGNVGVLWEPCCGTRVGLSWRSQVRHHIKGDAKFKDVPEAFQSTFSDTRVKAKTTLPQQVALSGYYEFNPCWAVLADVTWFNWNKLRELRFTFDNGLPDGVTTLRWENTFRYSLGFTYRPNCCWAFKVGGAFDETPVRSKEYATPRVPDSNRYWITGGIHYQWYECLGIDVAYAHVFADKSKIDKSDFALEEDLLRGGLRGHWNSYVNIISAQLVYSF